IYLECILGGVFMNQSVTPLKEIIKNRRAVKKGYTNEEVTEDLVRELLADASWAPTHGMREPWRFVFVHQDRLPTFAREVGQTYPDELKENLVLDLLSDASCDPTHVMRALWSYVYIHKDHKPDIVRKVRQAYTDELKEKCEAYLNESNAILVALMDNPEQQNQKD